MQLRVEYLSVYLVSCRLDGTFTFTFNQREEDRLVEVTYRKLKVVDSNGVDVALLCVLTC
jgi:hypothetical protein